MSNITVVIPMHKNDEAAVKLLNRAVESVPTDVNVVISVKEGLDTNAFGKVKKNVKIVTTSKNDTFQELVLAGLESVDTKWFSVLEYDDIYTEIWQKNAERYIEVMPDTSVFLFLNDLYDYNEDKFIGFGNDAPWASAFSDEIGYIDAGSLDNYFDFYLCGSIINVDDFKQCGGLKVNIKYTFWYEFLLRLTEQGKKIFVVPKIAYKHYMNRPDSLAVEFTSKIGEKEAKYWFDVAKKEYHFKKDRDIEPYVEKETEEEETEE